MDAARLRLLEGLFDIASRMVLICDIVYNTKGVDELSAFVMGCNVYWNRY